MKAINLCLACGLFGLSYAAAQEESKTNSVPASSLELAINQTPEARVKFLLDVAQAYLNEGDMEAALDAYERILQIDPNNVQARYISGHVYISTKKYAKAEKSLLALAEEFPDDFKLWNNLAWLYATAEDPAYRDGRKAIKFAHEAMTLAPNDYHVWSTLSEAYYVCGEYEKAYRSITHMASLAARYGTDITKESVEEYNEQIRKCKRAMDTAEALKDESEE
jgi:tetratricopeptide (TPR) repeat protein